MSVSKEELKQELSELEERLEAKVSTKQDIGNLERKLDEKFASKQDLADVKVELMGAMTSIADNLKRHFDFTVERLRSDKDDAVEIQLADHEQRLEKLESRN